MYQTITEINKGWITSHITFAICDGCGAREAIREYYAAVGGLPSGWTYGYRSERLRISRTRYIRQSLKINYCPACSKARPQAQTSQQARVP